MAMFPEFLGLTQLAWQAIAALTGVLTLAVGGTAAVVAYFQYRANQSIREDQSRPYVVVDFEPSPASSQLFDIVIRNIGTTPALDVKLRLDPQPERARETPGYPLADSRVFSGILPMLAPGRELRLFFDSMPERSKAQLPMTFRINATYENSRGKNFTESTVVDMDIGRGSMYVDVYGLHHIAKSLRAIEKTHKKVESHLKNPIHVATEALDEYRTRLRAEAAEARRQHDELRARLNPPVETDDDAKDDGS